MFTPTKCESSILTKCESSILTKCESSILTKCESSILVQLSDSASSCKMMKCWKSDTSILTVRQSVPFRLTRETKQLSASKLLIIMASRTNICHSRISRYVKFLLKDSYLHILGMLSETECSVN